MNMEFLFIFFEMFACQFHGKIVLEASAAVGFHAVGIGDYRSRISCDDDGSSRALGRSKHFLRVWFCLSNKRYYTIY